MVTHRASPQGVLIVAHNRSSVAGFTPFGRGRHPLCRQRVPSRYPERGARKLGTMTGPAYVRTPDDAPPPLGSQVLVRWGNARQGAVIVPGVLTWRGPNSVTIRRQDGRVKTFQCPPHRIELDVKRNSKAR